MFCEAFHWPIQTQSLLHTSSVTVMHTVYMSFRISLQRFFHTKYVFMWFHGLSGLGNYLESAQAQKTPGGHHDAMEES